MKRKLNIEKQIRNIRIIMKKMDPSDRELLSDKLISYLLFDAQSEQDNNNKNSSERKKTKEETGLSKEEIKTLKELAKKTEELKNLLGDKPGFFM